MVANEGGQVWPLGHGLPTSDLIYYFTWGKMGRKIKTSKLLIIYLLNFGSDTEQSEFQV